MKPTWKSFLMAIFLLHVGSVACAAQERLLRVGIFQMPPLNYTDEQGVEQGLYPDLLREIVRAEKWQLVFVPGSWGQCYDRLLNDEIDLITTVAYSEERAQVFAYNQEAVADIWGKVYTRPGTQISDISTLDGARVAVARKDINGQNFLETAHKLGVEPVAVEVESHDDIFSEISLGNVVAGVVPQHFGFREAAKYQLVPTTIEFQPFPVFLASRKNTNQQILAHIDKHLSQWKRDPDSFYYERVAYWMGGRALERKVVPAWVYWSLLSIFGGLAALALVNVSLKRQVRSRTRELADREARFRKLSETTRAVPWELDVATAKFTYIGPRIVDVLGYPPEEWQDIGSWAAKVHPDDRDRAVDFCSLQTAQGQDHDFVYRGLHKDGREVWVHDIVTVSLGAHGPEKLYGYFVDITEIREHEQRFQKMFREHNAVMLLIDPEAKSIVDANSAACNFYGYRREELTGMAVQQLNPLSADEINDAMRQATQTGQNYFAFTHRLASGELRAVEIYSTPIRINAKTHLFAIVHDVTDRQKLMEERGRAEQLAVLGTVAAGVAHEINNPIQGILNYAALLLRSPEHRDQVLDLAERITRESERIAKITRDLLHYSKDNRNEMKSVNMQELIQSALSLIVPKVRPSGITVHTELSEATDDLLVNPQGIQQVVINLVDNAYDALRMKDLRRADKVILVRSYQAELGHKSRFCIEVQDNGVGMSEKVLARARDAFFSTKPASEGTGLGLSIVSEIVGKHQGELEIASHEGEYTKVIVSLPLPGQA